MTIKHLVSGFCGLETYQTNVYLSGPSYTFYFNTFKYLNSGRDADPSPPSSAVVKKEYSYTSTPPMGRTACTEPQCLSKGALYTSKHLNWFLGYTTSVGTLCNFLSYYIVGCLGLKHLIYWYVVFPFFSNILRLQTLWSILDLFLISNFRRVLNVVYFLLGDSDTGESPKRKNTVLDLLRRNRQWLAPVILSLSFSLCVCVCVCIYIYIYM